MENQNRKNNKWSRGTVAAVAGAGAALIVGGAFWLGYAIGTKARKQNHARSSLESNDDCTPQDTDAATVAVPTEDETDVDAGGVVAVPTEDETDVDAGGVVAVPTEDETDVDAGGVVAVPTEDETDVDAGGVVAVPTEDETDVDAGGVVAVPTEDETDVDAGGVVVVPTEDETDANASGVTVPAEDQVDVDAGVVAVHAEDQTNADAGTVAVPAEDQVDADGTVTVPTEHETDANADAVAVHAEDQTNADAGTVAVPADDQVDADGTVTVPTEHETDADVDTVAVPTEHQDMRVNTNPNKAYSLTCQTQLCRKSSQETISKVDVHEEIKHRKDGMVTTICNEDAHSLTISVYSCSGCESNQDIRALEPDEQNKRQDDRCTPQPSISSLKLNNLNALLGDIYRRHVTLRDEDFKIYYAVFNDVFAVLQKNMKNVDCYYGRYNSRKQFAGSHADKLRIGRPDEFDMDVVIRMPLNDAEASNAADSDLVLEPHVPGHVRVRGGKQYDSLPSRDNWEINRTAYNWCDGESYILRSKFTDWFKSVVRRALNQLPKGACGLPIVETNDKVYHLSTRESGPACTLTVKRDDGFQLDVDLVPALKIPEARWPPDSDYRKIPLGCQCGDWLLVPKAARGTEEASRSWRVALHMQEKRLFDNQQRLRQAIRLVKKLRDSLGMKEIASYYIKTIFLWEIIERKNSTFWNKSEGTIFKVMVRKLYEAVQDRRIPYFWNDKNNLIGHVNPQVLEGYKNKLEKLVQTLEEPQISLDKVAKFLLTPTEYEAYSTFLREPFENYPCSKV